MLHPLTTAHRAPEHQPPGAAVPMADSAAAAGPLRERLPPGPVRHIEMLPDELLLAVFAFLSPGVLAAGPCTSVIQPSLLLSRLLLIYVPLLPRHRRLLPRVHPFPLPDYVCQRWRRLTDTLEVDWQRRFLDNLWGGTLAWRTVPCQGFQRTRRKGEDGVHDGDGGGKDKENKNKSV